MSYPEPPKPLRLGAGRPPKDPNKPAKTYKKTGKCRNTKKDPTKPPHPNDPTQPKGVKVGAKTANAKGREIFTRAIQSGSTWDDALFTSGIDAIEAAQILDTLMIYRRDGAAVYMLAERHLITAMSTLAELQVKADDEKVRVVAASKLSDTAYRVLISKPYLDKVNQKTELPSLNQNTWDGEFTNAHSDNC